MLPCLLFYIILMEEKRSVMSENHKVDNEVIAILEVSEVITDAEALSGEGFHTIVITMVAINIIAIRIITRIWTGFLFICLLLF